MKIGIDIDDTLTDSWSTLMPHFSTTFGVSLDRLASSKPYYPSVNDKCSIDEYFDMVEPIYDNITPTIPIKEDAKEVIDKLHKLGCQIIFITSRGKGFTNSYELTKNYLAKNKIYYDKLIVNKQAKDKVCIAENVDIFIDDSYKHCKSVAAANIDVLMFSTKYNTQYQEFKRVNNWKEIYEYIKARC